MKSYYGCIYESIDDFDGVYVEFYDDGLASVGAAEPYTIGEYVYIPRHIDECVIKFVQDDAFERCEKVVEINAGKSEFEIIGSSAFEGCNNLSRVTLPSSLKMIFSRAFADCPNLTEIVFGDPNNWFANGKIIDLSSPAEAAKLLTGELADAVWIKLDGNHT